MEHLTIDVARRLLSGALPAPERERWEAHLRDCVRCRELLGTERTWSGVLNLGHTPVTATAHADETEASASARAARIQARIAGHPHRGRLRLVLESVAVVLLAAALVWQLSHESRATAVPAEEIPISPDLQSKVIANLDALQALQEDPWLPQDYEAVQMLDTFIASDPL